MSAPEAHYYLEDKKGKRSRTALCGFRPDEHPDTLSAHLGRVNCPECRARADSITVRSGDGTQQIMDAEDRMIFGIGNDVLRNLGAGI